jgi:hypothetical protein
LAWEEEGERYPNW